MGVWPGTTPAPAMCFGPWSTQCQTWLGGLWILIGCPTDWSGILDAVAALTRSVAAGPGKRIRGLLGLAQIQEMRSGSFEAKSCTSWGLFLGRPVFAPSAHRSCPWVPGPGGRGFQRARDFQKGSPIRPVRYRACSGGLAERDLAKSKLCPIRYTTTARLLVLC